ncbi:hypothetical protein LCGC14_0312930 [marine sediment metagenome]|uniref:Uncharacterized protein n=1 Tax=marine sediment metagenome TaxID=412755 RepID=A0A0F9W8M6_9ZZZZ
MTTAEEHREAITTQAHLVRVARENHRHLSANMSRAVTAFETKLITERQELADASDAVLTTEAQLRALTLAAFADDPTNKAPGPGVGIRVATNLEYDPGTAYDYALSHSLFLTLDRRAFDRHASAETPSFVTKTEIPQATITAKLSEALGLPAEGGPF